MFDKSKIIAVLLTTYYLLLTTPVFACHPSGTPPPGQPGHPPNQPIPGFGPCPAGLRQIEQVFENILSVIVGLGFIALFVMLVWAGFKYLTSGGEPKTLQQAHQTVTWALLGVIFMALAWLLLQLVEAFTGIPKLTFFNIGILCGGGRLLGSLCR